MSSMRNFKETSRKDKIAEDSSSEFIGVITTRPDNQNDEKIQKLKKVLHTPEVKKFIEETFHGDIIPVFE
ncbi:MULTISPECIES: MetQ/NlpA family ABC transporter substrate-binding protein [Aeribacillus]|jgi:ABC-type metal ion transport system, periplasmic component/surface antigen|uniref:Uncharacterized protein n=2 Tax=Bacillaceae TaxID=186817 RepID=A0A161ZSK8_9BACI|nr:MetQ/NlpA family ABC transporter substrate-binding protein [Aeribacillus pallidus]ASS91235.1 hypothetical protein AP3564_14325 [Aeribacillus pallidus]KZN96027.1 hypothetical protein AZI98_10935 [Aeribacillus pallidus]REJ21284.1 MAG: hypothetical protein C6W54_17940 [Bacillaceae bacterium]